MLHGIPRIVQRMINIWFLEASEIVQFELPGMLVFAVPIQPLFGSEGSRCVFFLLLWEWGATQKTQVFRTNNMTLDITVFSLRFLLVLRS